MRHLLTTLALCLISAFTFAQIGAVKPADKKTKSTDYSSHVVLQQNLQSQTYTLYVQSDNNLDKTKINLSLGDHEQAIESVKNLLALYEEEGEVSLLGYVFICGKKQLSFKKVGTFKKTYGTYAIEKTALQKMLKDLTSK